MGGIGLWQIIVVFVFLSLVVSLVVWVCGRILRKAGYSRWWSLILFMPIVNLVMLWVFAFAKWPNLAETNK